MKHGHCTVGLSLHGNPRTFRVCQRSFSFPLRGWSLSNVVLLVLSYKETYFINQDLVPQQKKHILWSKMTISLRWKCRRDLSSKQPSLSKQQGGVVAFRKKYILGQMDHLQMVLLNFFMIYISFCKLSYILELTIHGTCLGDDKTPQ